jgi:hypothetical protein
VKGHVDADAISQDSQLGTMAELSERQGATTMDQDPSGNYAETGMGFTVRHGARSTGCHMVAGCGPEWRHTGVTRINRKIMLSE